MDVLIEPNYPRHDERLRPATQANLEKHEKRHCHTEDTKTEAEVDQSIISHAVRLTAESTKTDHNKQVGKESERLVRERIRRI